MTDRLQAQHLLRYQDDPDDTRWICTTDHPSRDPGCPLTLLHDCYSILRTAARYGIDVDPNWPDHGTETYDALGTFLWPDENEAPLMIEATATVSDEADR